jgi:hypothetical protein
MTCDRFERWLDEGRPETGAAEARAHAEGCAGCAKLLAADVALAAAFDAGGGEPAGAAGAPAGFADEVMRRVAATRSAADAVARARGGRPARGAAWSPDALELPWWWRAAAHPAVALACVVAGLTLGWGDQMMNVANGSLAALSAWALGAPSAAAGHSAVLLGYALALAPALAWGSWWLWRIGERVAEPGMRVVARRSA